MKKFIVVVMISIVLCSPVFATVSYEKVDDSHAKITVERQMTLSRSDALLRKETAEKMLADANAILAEMDKIGVTKMESTNP